MSFPLVEIDFPEIEPDPDNPDAMREAIMALARFRVRRVFVNVKTKTAAYTINATEDRVILADASGAGFTITLPLAANADAVEYVVKAIDVTGGSVIVDGDGSETIDGAVTYTLATQYDLVRLVSDGTAWYVTGRHT